MALNREQQGLVVAYIQTEWAQLSPQHRPWGVWIREHEPLPPDARELNHATVPVVAVWFMNRGIISPRSLSDWQRYDTLHFVQPWHAGSLPAPQSSVHRKQFEIGLAAFAAYSTGESLYVEYLWGGTFGRGAKLHVTAAGDLISDELLWVA